jgi:hypothetical protein
MQEVNAYRISSAHSGVSETLGTFWLPIIERDCHKHRFKALHKNQRKGFQFVLADRVHKFY